jgi:hypothetical protein
MTDATVLALLPAVGALLLVASPRPWRALRPVVTIAHEGGHVAVALLAGRRLSGVRVHADASGLTRSRGRDGGPGMVATLLAGYVTPCVLGLAAAALVSTGRYLVVLATGIVLLVALLVTIRNVFGVVAVVATGAALVGLTAYATPSIQQTGAALLAWFLLFGGVRSVVDLRRGRRGGARDSDADQLARLTRVPAVLWVLTFGVVALGSLAAATALLMRA